MKRRSILGAAMMLPTVSALQAQGTFPSAPIRIIVPLGAGGVYDTVARLIAKDLARQFGVPVIVENKPGGNYVIGMRAVSTAKPDGYTIGLSAGTILSQTPIIFPDVTYKLEDFSPVAPLLSARNVLAVNAASPAKNLSDFVRLAKASTKPTQIATTGVGSVSHLSVLQLATKGNFEIEAVPFKSNPDALLAVMGGYIQATALLLSSAIGPFHAGKVRILAYSGKSRHPAIPEVPTYAESGYPELTSETWSAMFAPAGTPATVVAHLNKAIAIAIAQPELKQALPVDTETFFASPAELRQIAIKDRQYWQKFFSDPQMLKKVRGA